MNHRDRNAHNHGFTCGHMSQGYKPKDTVDGVKLTMWLVMLVSGMVFIGKMFGLV